MNFPDKVVDSFLQGKMLLIAAVLVVLLAMPCFAARTSSSRTYSKISSRLSVKTTAPHHQEIKVPLGLMWGDSVQKLEEMARPGGFSVTRREESGNKTILTVHGLLGVALRENIFTFQRNALIEIEYRYGDPSWSAARYQDFFDSFRRMYDTKYGAGTQLIRLNVQKPNDVTIALSGYQWSQSSSVLDLFYYSAEQAELHAYRLISLHYKAP